MPALSFTVYGPAAPQGSLRIVQRGRHAKLVCDNAKTMPWRQQVAGTALVEMGKQAVNIIARPHAVEVSAAFFFGRPPSVKKTAAKTTKPDLDKLQRALFDALTGVAFEDDSQVTVVRAAKQFGVPARTEIVISLLETEQRAA